MLVKSVNPPCFLFISHFLHQIQMFLYITSWHIVQEFFYFLYYQVFYLAAQRVHISFHLFKSACQNVSLSLMSFATDCFFRQTWRIMFEYFVDALFNAILVLSGKFQLTNGGFFLTAARFGKQRRRSSGLWACRRTLFQLLRITPKVRGPSSVTLLLPEPLIVTFRFYFLMGKIKDGKYR